MHINLKKGAPKELKENGICRACYERRKRGE